MLDFGTDKYGLNAYLFDTHERRRGRTTTASCSRPTKSGARRRRRHPARGRVGRRQGDDRRRRARRQDRRHARQGRGAHAATSRRSACSTPPSPAPIASWPGWPGEPGFTRRLRGVRRPEVPHLHRGRLRHPRGRHRQRGDLRRAGPLLGDRPTCRSSSTSSETYKPDLLLVGYPITDEFQHQFLGLVTPTLPGGARQPGLRRRPGQRHARRPRRRARGLPPPGLPGRRRHARPGPRA